MNLESQTLIDLLIKDQGFTGKILKKVPAIILILDDKGYIQYVNPWFEELAGYTLEEIRGKEWFATFLPPEDRDTIRQLFHKATHVESTRGNINPILDREGRRIYIEWYDMPLLDDEGNLISLLAAGQDVSALWDAKNKLIGEKDRFRALADNLPYGVQESDFEGTITYSNLAHARMLGYERAEMVGMKIWDVLAEEKRAAFRKYFATIVSNRPAPSSFEDVNITRDGREIHVKVDWQYLYDSERQLVGTVAVIVDITEEKLAIARATDSEERLKEAQRLAQLGSWELDIVNNHLIWSDQIFSLFEVDKDGFEPTYQSFLEYVHPEDREMVNNAYLGSLKTRQPYQVAHRLLMPNGRIKWVEERCFTEFDDDAKPLVSRGTVQDITERVAATKALEDSEERLRRVIDAVSDGIWDWNPETGEYYLSPRWKEIFGYRDDELENVESTFLELVHPEDRERVAEAVRAHFESSEPFNLEIRVRHKNGRYLWILTRGEGIRDHAGKVIRMLGTITDITDKKLAENALAESRAHLNFLVSSSPAVIYTCDVAPPYRVTFISDNVETIFRGFTPEQFTTDVGFYSSLVHPEDKQRIYNDVNEILDDGHCAYEYRIRMADGEYRWFRDVLNVIKDGEGEAVEMIGSMSDITQRKQAELDLEMYREHLEEMVADRTKSLEEANNAKTQFLSRVSHELRTPMNAILGFSEVLERENLGSQQKEYVREINLAGSHLLELINELLDLSRIESGNLAISLQPVSVISAIEQSWQLTHSLFDEYGVKFVTVDHCNQNVIADQFRLRQVLLNLFSNAAKYNSSGGQVRVSCKLRDEFVRIEVSDTGPGISEKFMKRLFTPFDRLGAENSKTEGTGIGLPLSRQLCELMGGRLGVESTPGKGSVFWVELPKASVAIVEPEPGHHVRESEGKAIVLYIEDNQPNLRLMRAMLRNSKNYTLVTAIDGAAGLDKAVALNPDIILLDIHLPGMSGYEILGKLRENPTTRSIPVIALSADAMPEEIERGLNSGFHQYLTKPINLKELLVTLGNLTNERN